MSEDTYVDRSKANRKPVKVVVVPVTGKESLEFQVRLSGGGQASNILVSESLDKKMQQLLARDLFNFLRGVFVECVLEDYTDRTLVSTLRIDDLKARATELFTTTFSWGVPQLTTMRPVKTNKKQRSARRKK